MYVITGAIAGGDATEEMVTRAAEDTAAEGNPDVTVDLRTDRDAVEALDLANVEVVEAVEQLVLDVITNSVDTVAKGVGLGANDPSDCKI